MPLIELVPPSVLPRGHCSRRPAVPGSPSLMKFQLMRGLLSTRSTPAGMWIHGSRSGGPASSSTTRAPSSERRLATTHPADPAPMTM